MIHAQHRPAPRPRFALFAHAGLFAAKTFIAFTFLAISAVGAGAQDSDSIRVNGLLSDTDFYHLVTCGAQPDGDCGGPYVRWRSTTVSVALLEPEPGFSNSRLRRLNRALNRAIDEINGVGAGIRLTRRDQQGKRAQIVVTPTRLVSGERTQGLTNVTPDAEMGVGYMSIYWSPNRRITRAGIAIAADIGLDELESVMLEELFQTLGFIYDVDTPAYEGVSVLSENSNDTTRIRGQDRKVLLMHYPPG